MTSENGTHYFLESSTGPKEWTFMVYLDADCNLEGAGIDDLNEMEKEGSDSNINIVVQMDRISGYDSSNGDWTGTRRYYVTKDVSESTISSSTVQSLGEVNMGDPNTLQSFIQWAKSNYPANNYALILWDHGSGVMFGSDIGGVCWDDSNSHDYLTLTEVESVLSTNYVNLVGFDACLMGATEIHYQIKNYVDVIIGSEELEPGDGYPYDDILQYLRSNPTATPQQLGQQIVIKYNNFYSSPYDDVTQAAANAFTNDFMNSLISFITDLNASVAGQKSGIDTARAASLEYEGETYIDLYDFAQEIQSSCTGAVDTSSQDLMDNITAIVIEEAHSSSKTGSHGLSIYFPDNYLDYSSTYNDTAFAQDLEWDEFLLNYYSGGSPGPSDDIFEENDDFPEAPLITAGDYYNLICDDLDDDYFNISLTVGDPIDITLWFDYVSNDLDLYLYDPTGTEVDFSESWDNFEWIYYDPLVSGIYTILVTQYSSNSLVPYDLWIYLYDDDVYEENDVFLDAAIINNNTIYTDLTCNDDDFYAFWATEGYLVNITIQFTYAEGDLDLYLLDDFNFSLTVSSTATNYENILWGATYTGWHVIQVDDYQINKNYTLYAGVVWVDDLYESNNDINSSAELLSYGEYSDLTCLNPDFYNITLPADVWINISLYFENINGDIDLYLYNSSQFEIAWSESYTDNEFIFYYIDIAGIYYIEVYDYEINLNYTLCVNETTQVWDDQYEQNDWLDEPVNLPIGASYTNLTAIDWDVFAISVSWGYYVTIILDYNASEGDLDLYLFNNSWDILTWSTETGDQDIITITTTVSTQYLILVHNYENNMHYNLTITQTPIQEPGGIPGFSPFFIISSLGLIISIIDMKKSKKKFDGR